MATTSTGKRKRNQVSYLADDYFDGIDLDNEEAAAETVESDDGDSDDNTEFGSRKKAKPKAKKKRKLNMPRPKKEKPFRFMDLPAELRDEIYELALTDPNGLTLVSGTKGRRRIARRGQITMEDGSQYYGRWRPNGRRYWRRAQKMTTVGLRSRSFSPNLLAVSKQIHEEASSILYKQEIVLEDMMTVHTFLAQIGHNNRQLLTELTVKGQVTDQRLRNHPASVRDVKLTRFYSWGEGAGVHKANNYAAFSMMSTCFHLQSVFLDCTVGHYRTPERLARQVFRDGHHFLEAIGSANGKYDAALDVLELSERNFDKRSYGRWNMNDGDQQQTEEEKEATRMAAMNDFRTELRKLLDR